MGSCLGKFDKLAKVRLLAKQNALEAPRGTRHRASVCGKQTGVEGRPDRNV